MKILHILKSYLPITENWLFHLLQNAPDCQHVIFAETIIPGAFEHDDFTFFALPHSLKAHEGNTLADKLKRRVKKWKNDVKGITKESYVLKIISLEEPDIIHIHFGTMALDYLDVLQKTDLPGVVSFYGYDYNRKYSYQKLVTLNIQLFCEGPAAKQELIKHGFYDKNIHIIPLGIDPDLAIQTTRQKGNSLNLVQIASFSPKKGHIYALEALKLALPTCPQIHLTFIGGDSPQKNFIKQQVSTLGLEKFVTIKGIISPEIVYEELSRHDVFIHPSAHAPDGDHEGGAPVILLSAQACGLPIIATTHQDIPSYVLDRKSGYLVPEKDSQSLAEAIKYFYHLSAHDFETYKQAGKEHVRKHYNIKKNAVLLSSEYNSIIRNRP